MHALGSCRRPVIVVSTRAGAPVLAQEGSAASLLFVKEMVRIEIRGLKNNCAKRWTSRVCHPPVTRTARMDAQDDLRGGLSSPLKRGCE